MRLLFCIPTTQLSGGVKVIFELAQGMAQAGDTVHVFSYAGQPKWFSLQTPLIEAKSFAEIPYREYDWVIVSNAFMVPMVLPHLAATEGKTRGLFFCQDYESFHHSTTNTYEGFMEECPTFVKLYQLPLPIITQSRAVQSLIKEHTGVNSWVVPVGLNKSTFFPRQPHHSGEVKRVLMVGNYLMPYKGMKDGFEALRQLAAEIPVQLVMVTQESRNRALFADLPYPVEIHFRPTEEKIPDIMASCDVYCCTSWYEGLGLPALESFCCGLPVVSMRTYGVSDYGVDEVNLLLASPNDASDLSEKLKRLLLDAELQERFRQAGFQTVANDYNWEHSFTLFREAIGEIDRAYSGPGEVDGRAMQGLLDQLEAEGNLTPIEVFRSFQAPAAELKDLCAGMIESGQVSEVQAKRVFELRQAFGEYLNNSQAEYYDAFKTKYDLCQLILSFKGHPNFGSYLQLILTKNQQSGNPTSASFSEIQYPVS
ncbi:D-inositol-3-phosphate glycosyltransferase [Abditibacteriota bacterium]|nr:D-inositol-3-phosphate glycosyltransferase [Abditibacteriota bacterium]